MCVRQFYSGVKLAADFISSCENKFVLQCVCSGVVVCAGGGRGRCVREGAVRFNKSNVFAPSPVRFKEYLFVMLLRYSYICSFTS